MNVLISLHLLPCVGTRKRECSSKLVCSCFLALRSLNDGENCFRQSLSLRKHHPCEDKVSALLTVVCILVFGTFGIEEVQFVMFSC